MRRHLAAAGCRIGFRAHPLQKHFVGSDAEHEHQGAIAIVREEPIVGGLQNQTRGREDGFVACAADLKEQSVLALELDLAIVETAREKHRAIDPDRALSRSRP